MRVKPSDFYDENYFYPSCKVWTDQFGQQRKYYGPARDWHAFSAVALWIKKSFPDVNRVLDVACSAGSFVARARGVDLDAWGCDISRYAIANCVEGSEGHLFHADITGDAPRAGHDLVTAFDLLEHIYQKDLDRALDYILGSCKPGGHLFFCICAARTENELWQHTSEDDEVPADKVWLAVAGHVNIKVADDWIKLLESRGVRTDYRRMIEFQLWREKQFDFSRVDSWSTRNIYIGQKA